MVDPVNHTFPISWPNRRDRSLVFEVGEPFPFPRFPSPWRRFQLGKLDIPSSSSHQSKCFSPYGSLPAEFLCDFLSQFALHRPHPSSVSSPRCFPISPALLRSKSPRCFLIFPLALPIVTRQLASPSDHRNSPSISFLYGKRLRS